MVFGNLLFFLLGFTFTTGNVLLIDGWISWHCIQPGHVCGGHLFDSLSFM